MNYSITCLTNNKLLLGICSFNGFLTIFHLEIDIFPLIKNGKKIVIKE